MRRRVWATVFDNERRVQEWRDAHADLLDGGGTPPPEETARLRATAEVSRISLFIARSSRDSRRACDFEQLRNAGVMAHSATLEPEHLPNRHLLLSSPWRLRRVPTTFAGAGSRPAGLSRQRRLRNSAPAAGGLVSAAAQHHTAPTSHTPCWTLPSLSPVALTTAQPTTSTPLRHLGSPSAKQDTIFLNKGRSTPYAGRRGGAGGAPDCGAGRAG